MSVEMELTISAVTLVSLVVGALAVLWLALEGLVWLVLRTAQHLTK